MLCEANSQDLIISGVIDGPLSGGVPKAFELYVKEDILDLSEYGIGVANNGGGSDGEEFELSGTASKGDYIYVASESSSFSTYMGFAPTFTTGVANVNGDDPFELYFQGTVIDVYGDVALDGSGEAWEYLDGWAYRKSNTANATAFNINDWTFSGPNELDGCTSNATCASVFPSQTYTPGANDDDQEPTVTTSFPEDNEESVDVKTNLSITFNEGVKAGTGNITIADSTMLLHEIAMDSSIVSVSNETVTIALSESLPTDNWIFINIDSAAVLDLANNAFAGVSDSTTWNFKTNEVAFPELVSLSPADDASDVPITVDLEITFDEEMMKGASGHVLIIRTVSDTPQDTITVDITEDQVTISEKTVAIHLDDDLQSGSDYYVNIDSAAFLNTSSGAFEGFMGSTAWSFTTINAPTLISVIQGDGAQSVLDGDKVVVEAIVVGDFQRGNGENGSLDGFFLQEEDSDADADLETSEGILVYTGSSPSVDVSVGDKVQVSGTVDEFFGLTEITSVTSLTVLSSGNTLPTAATISLPVAQTASNSDGDPIPDLERYEGMRVTFPDTLTVSELFQLDRYGEIGLTSGGRVYQFTQKNEPSVSGYEEHLENVAKRKIILDDGQSIQNPDPIVFPDGDLTSDDVMRMGDYLVDLTGVLSYSRASGGSGDEFYRVHPTVTPVFQQGGSRQTVPDAVEGTLKVAGLNVLNYFVTLDDGGTTANGSDPRGANNSVEFLRQTQKLITALVRMEADVYGLIEMENDFDASSSGSAIKLLVETLNDSIGEDRFDWVYPETQFIGTDAIAVGVIYDSTKVSLAPGTTVEILDDSDRASLGLQTDTAIFDGPSTNRSPMAVTLKEKASGETFTVIVCHMKSKGTEGTFDDPDLNNGEGSAYTTRLRGVEALNLWIASDPTGSGDPDFLILGDFNAYAKEAPIDKMLDEGYINIIEDRLGSDIHSYVFDGQIGTLDYAFVTNTLAVQTSGVTEWTINSNEADAIDYNTDFERPIDIFDGTIPFRTSDHDPVIVGLQLGKVYDNGWLSGAPDDSSYTYIISDYSSIAFATKNLSVDENINMRITPNSFGNLVVHGDIHNNGFIGMPSAVSLVNYGEITGSGKFAIERKTTHSKSTGKYSFVGSPVENGLVDSLGKIVYHYDETVPFDFGVTDGLNSYKTVAEDTMIIGRGYASAFTGTVIFEGKPNTGSLTTTITKTDYPSASDDPYEGYNIVSNPYPCAISFSKFVSENTYNPSTNPSGSLEGSIWLWDDNQSNVERGSNSDFITINMLGSVSGTPKNGKNWGGNLGTNQGFFVKAADPISYGMHQVRFTDSMKVKSNNADSSFFRLLGHTNALDVKRLKLTVRSVEGDYDETLIGFTENATIGHDPLLDAPKLAVNKGLKIFSRNTFENLAIQGLPNSEEKLEVPLGVHVADAGEYIIKWDELDTDLWSKYQIWLRDNANAKTTKLTSGTEYRLTSAVSNSIHDLQLLIHKTQDRSNDLSIISFVNENEELEIVSQQELTHMTISISSLDGRVLWKTENAKTERLTWKGKTIDFKSGVYIVSIHSKQGVLTRKIGIR